MVTIYTVPGVPVTVMPIVGSEVTGHAFVHQGSGDAGRSAASGIIRHNALNLRMQNRLGAFGVPDTFLVQWDMLEKGLETAINLSPTRVSEVMQAKVQICNSSVSFNNLVAMQLVAGASARNVKAAFPRPLKSAFPKMQETVVDKYCWTVAKNCTLGIEGPLCDSSNQEVGCPGAKEHQPELKKTERVNLRPSGVVIFDIRLSSKCDFQTLTTDQLVLSKVEMELKDSIADLAGLGTQRAGVGLFFAKLDPGLVQATVTPPDGSMASAVQMKFTDDAKVREMITKALKKVAGLEQLCGFAESGIQELGHPRMKVCPQHYCPPERQVMRSHGSHTQCRADMMSEDTHSEVEDATYQGFTLARCESTCLNSTRCHGIQYGETEKGRHCQLWNRPIEKCSMLDVPSVTSKWKLEVSECFSKCNVRSHKVGHLESGAALGEPLWMTPVPLLLAVAVRLAASLAHVA